MATLAEQAGPAAETPNQRERRFYLGMAIAITAIVLAGFGGYILIGLSSFAAPWWVHVHAVSYMAWIALYLNQNRLVVRGALSQHARIGRIMGVLAIWMVVVGMATLQLSLASHRAPPPVFTAAFMIVMDGLGIVIFAALVLAGIALRRHSDWHRRIMLSATVLVIHPGLGRLTVLTIGFSWTTIVLGQLALMAAAALFDWRTRGRVHPALLVGIAAIAGLGLVTPPLAGLPGVVAFADALAGG